MNTNLNDIMLLCMDCVHGCRIDFFLCVFRISSIQDPHVEGIGKIKLNSSGTAFAVSGYTDFTVWKIDSGQATFQGHSVVAADGIANAGSLTTDACFASCDTVLNICSSSELGLFHFDI